MILKRDVITFWDHCLELGIVLVESLIIKEISFVGPDVYLDWSNDLICLETEHFVLSPRQVVKTTHNHFNWSPCKIFNFMHDMSNLSQIDMVFNFGLKTK